MSGYVEIHIECLTCGVITSTDRGIDDARSEAQTHLDAFKYENHVIELIGESEPTFTTIEKVTCSPIHKGD